MNFRQKQDMDDYHTFLELVFISLRRTPGCGVKVPKPGLIHQAHRLAKCLYSLHIFLFQKQLQLTAREVTTIHEFSLFCSPVNYQAWFLVPSLTDAPSNNLQLLQELNTFRTTETLGKTVLTTFKCHI